MNRTALLTLTAICALGASAQVLVNSEGKLLLGETVKFESSQKGVSNEFVIGPAYPAAEEAGNPLPATASTPDSVVPYSNSAIVVLGTGTNNSKGLMTFGDGGYVGIGEYSTYDSDVLSLVGDRGISYSTASSPLILGSHTVFSWRKSSTSALANPFIFYTDVKANGVLLNSDMRLKKDVTELEDSYLSLSGVTPVSFRLASAADGNAADAQAQKASAASGDAQEQDRVRYGFVAQEVKEVFPDLVVEDEDGYLAIDYIGFIPVLVDAVRSLSAKVDEQAAVIDALSAETSPRRVARAGADIIGAESVVLRQNNPNPFTASTVIEYSLPASVAAASLHIYDLRGTQIQSIALRDRGDASVTIDGSTLQPGMYIYTLIADGVEADSKRMILTE